MTSLPEICGQHAYYWDNFKTDHMVEVVKNGLAEETASKVEARKAHAQKFNYDNYIKAYVEVYKSLLEVE